MRQIIIFLVLIFAFNINLKADSWAKAKTKNIYSLDSSFMLRIIPTFTPDKYWDWIYAKPKKKKKFSSSDTTRIPCHAMLYKITENDTLFVWKKKLINRTSPINAIVSNDGKIIVTFDNWSSVGYGVDVMVVYNEKGELIKRYQLEDISPFPINDYELSISSIWWSCGKKFIDNHRIEICFVTENSKIKKRIFNINELKFE